MAKQGAKMRSGAVDYGRLYEQRIATYFAVKCALDPEVSDFWLLSNVDDVGAFDDIVLMVQDRANNKKLYCIQLKHTENKNALPVVLLEREASKDNKFGLSKYQDSYKTIEKNIASNNVDLLKDISLDQIYFVLWTNGPLDFKKKLQCIGLETVGGMSFLNTSTDANVYKVKNLPTSPTPFDENFLQQFYLLAKQVSATSLERTIKDKLLGEFEDVGNSAIITITDYFTKWSMGQGKTMVRITKSDIQTKLLEFLFLPHFVEPIKAHARTCNRFDLLNETLTSFNVTVINEIKFIDTIFNSIKYVLNNVCGSHLDIELSWNTELSPTHWNALKAVDNETTKRVVKILQERTMFVPSVNIKDLYFAAWQCRLIPLIINCGNSSDFIKSVLTKFERITKNFSLVLVNTDNSIDNSSLKIFRNMNCIEDTILRNKNLEEVSISMQGKKKINLQAFKDNTEILNSVTPDAYVKLMEGVVELGETIDIESYYIERDLRKPLLEMSVLDENAISKNREHLFNQDGDLFLLVEYDSNSLPLKYRNNSVSLLKYVKEADYREDEKIYILLTNLTDIDDFVTFAAMHLHMETKKSVHVMKLDGDYLEWSFSKGTVETLQSHLVRTNLLRNENSEYNIPEDDILKSSRSGINIISNNAGMGKTFMLHSISSKFEPNEWVCYINLSEHIPKLPTEGTLLFFLKYLFECVLKTTENCIRGFCAQVYVHCLQTRKLICLFDGYDEIASVNTMSFLKEAKDYGLRMWITTRPTYAKELEIYMENLSFEITHFSTEDHVLFLWKYFQSYYHVYKYDNDQIQRIIDVIGKCSSNLDKTFVVQPLQTRMFAEIFGDDINQLNEKEKLTLVDIYTKFVDVKLKEYKSYEAASLKKTLAKLALKLFFTEEQLENLLDFEDLAEEAMTFQDSYKKDSIVIGLNEKGEAVFGHRTFAEFLAAYWVAKQIVNRKGQYSLGWLPILEKLYYIEMIPVRIFFDRILSQNLPLHIAVLNNNEENVKTLLESEEFINTLDILGRSALHLAVTYGKYYDLYLREEVKGLKNVGIHSSVHHKSNQCIIKVLEEKQYEISHEIVETLLNKGLKNIADRFLRYDLFDYAMKSCSLNFVNILFKRYEKVTLHFEIGFSFEIFLCCIVKDNLHNILSKRKYYNFELLQNHENELRDMFKGHNSKLLTIQYNDMYLTEMAAWFGAKETLFELLKSGNLPIEQGYIVHKACLNGHVGILDLLYKMGADMQKLDESDWSPHSIASMQGRKDIIYHLLKNQVGMSPTTKMTPMHYSVQGGHLECVKTLIEYGASVNVRDAYDSTPLTYACQYGHGDIVDALIKSGQLDTSNNALSSALNVAAFHGNNDCVLKLLETDATDVNYVDSKGDTALVIASKRGFSNVISGLANSKLCDLNLMVRNETMGSLQMWCAGHGHGLLHTKLFLIKCNRKEYGGITALHFAARHGHTDCVKTLVDFGADKYLEDDITKCSPIVWASMYGVEKVIKVFLVNVEKEELLKMEPEVQLCLLWASMIGYEKCVEVLSEFIKTSELENASYEDPRVKTLVSQEFGMDLWFVRENENLPLVLAAKNGCTSVVITLLALKYRNNDGIHEALHWAARNGHLECVKELILAGADDDKKNEKRLSLLPIVWATMSGKTEVVKYFLSNKTKDYLENKDVHVALNFAATNGHYECLKLLLDFGLDVDHVYPDLNGTPLICACTHRGTLEVIDILLERNCNVAARNHDGLSALDIVAGNKKFDFVKKLINSGAFKDLIVEQNSELYGNLQLALKWAVDKEEHEFIEKLIGLGIAV